MIYSGTYGSAAYGGIPVTIRKMSGQSSIVLTTSGLGRSMPLLSTATNAPITLTSRARDTIVV